MITWVNLMCYCILSKEMKDKIKYSELIIAKYIHVDNLIKIQAKLGMLLKLLNIKDKTDEMYNIDDLDFVKDVIIEYRDERLQEKKSREKKEKEESNSEIQV